MGDFLFDDFPEEFCLSGQAAQPELFRLPQPGPLGQYLEQVKRLPLDNSPVVLGLHSNAEIDYYSSAAKAMWRNLIELQPRSAAAGGGVRREDYIAKVASDVAAVVPAQFDLLICRKRLADLAAPNPLQPTTIVLLQELERFNLLVGAMSHTLVDLQRALKGEIGMSSDLDDLVSLSSHFISIKIKIKQ
jgi:dynein heavy chain